jgi:hypothetical protein
MVIAIRKCTANVRLPGSRTIVLKVPQHTPMHEPHDRRQVNGTGSAATVSSHAAAGQARSEPYGGQLTTTTTRPGALIARWLDAELQRRRDTSDCDDDGPDDDDDDGTAGVLARATEQHADSTNGDIDRIGGRRPNTTAGAFPLSRKGILAESG